MILKAFSGTLNNGYIQWEDPNSLPKHAKVVVTVLEELDRANTPKKSLADFEGIWQDLPNDTKKQIDTHFNEIRASWERTI